MIGQNIGLPYLVPLAIEFLQQNPLVAGDFYEGDLLNNVLSIDLHFWHTRPDLRRLLEGIVNGTDPLPEDLHEA
jgi:hypothetical protein